jgi:predicted HTH transcriptional regulator
MLGGNRIAAHPIMQQRAGQRVFFVVAQEAAQYYKERNKLEKCGIFITDQERSLMRKAELLEIIRNGENSGVEFKRDDIRPEQLAKEIVALANLQGGRVLLGVEDNGTVTGIRRPDLQDQPFISCEEADIDETMRRGKAFFYPWQAVRETVLNALAHRDWSRSVDIEISSYADRLEIISPGALQNSMTVAKMIAGQRSPRNPLIMEILRDYGYVDARGMGVRTKIIPLMRQQNGVEAIFEAGEDSLKIILPRKRAL